MDPKEISVEEAERIFNEIDTSQPAPVDTPPEKPEEHTEVVEVEAPPSTLETEAKPEGSETPPAQEDNWLTKIEDADLRSKVEAEIGRIQQLEHRIKSDDGRVAAFQRKADELKRELQELKQKKPVVEQPADNTPSTPDEWKKVIEHDPELAKAVEALIRSERDKLRKELQESQKSVIAPIEEDRKSQQIERELQLLSQAIPEYKEIRETDMFKGWLEYEASPALQKAWNESLNHRDVIAVFNAFAVDMINSGRVQPPTQQAAPTPEVVPAQQTTVDPDKLAADRARKLQQTPVASKAPSLPSGSAKGPMTTPGGVVDLDSADELFKSLFKKEQ